VKFSNTENLHAFVESCVEPGSTIVSDGWGGYNGLSEKGYAQKTQKEKTGDDDNLLPHVHTVISLLKWLLGTMQGACSKEHIFVPPSARWEFIKKVPNKLPLVKLSMKR